MSDSGRGIVMAQMNLKEARAAKARLSKELDALVQKREQVAVVKIAPGEDAQDYINVTVDELTEKIDVCIDKLKKLGAAIRHANAGTSDKIAESVSEDVGSLVEEAILWRKEATLCKTLGSKNPRERKSEGYMGGDSSLVYVTTYDIEKYARRGDDLQRRAEEASARVDQLDLTIMVEADI